MKPPTSLIARAAVLFTWAALLVACQSTPPTHAPAPAAEARAVTLRQLGFVAQQEEWTLNLGVKLLFDSNVDTLTADGRDALREVARSLRELGIERLRVEGHTDNVGSTAYNQDLSLRRAESVAREFAHAGIPAEAIERIGHGLAKPVADNATALGRAQNRRVVITVRAD